MIMEPCTDSIDANQLAEILIRQVFTQYGLPKKMISDRGLLRTALLRYGAHALLELGVLQLACGAGDGSWRGGVHGPADIFAIFLRILLTALQLFLCPVSPIGSVCASPSRPF
jgi:hypothetical protein